MTTVNIIKVIDERLPWQTIHKHSVESGILKLEKQVMCSNGEFGYGRELQLASEYLGRWLG